MDFSWRRFVKIAELVAPFVLGAAGVPPTAVPLVVHGMQVAEEIGNARGLSGEQKKVIALDVITTGLTAVNVVRPNTIDIPALTNVISEGIDRTIEAVNAGQDIPLSPNMFPGRSVGGPV